MISPLNFAGVKHAIKDFSRTYKVFILAAFFVYLVFWAFAIYFAGVQRDQKIYPELPVSHVMDSLEYIRLSESLQSGEGFAQNGITEYFRTPGYPVLIASIERAAFGWPFAITLFQIALTFATALLVRKLGSLIFSNRVGEIASAAFLLNPYVWVITLTILSDIPFIFLFVLGLFIVGTQFKQHPYRTVFIAAVIAGASIYIRPMGLFALPVFIVPILISKIGMKERFLGSLIMVVVILVAMFPWISRNYHLSGTRTFSSLKSYNLASYNMPLFLSLEQGTSTGAVAIEIATTVGIQHELWKDAHFSDELDSYTKSVILERPFAYAKFHTVSTLPFFFVSPVTAFVENWYATILRTQAPAPKAAIFHLTQGNIVAFASALLSNGWYTLAKVLSGVIILLALCGIWHGRRKPIVWVFVFIIGYLALLAGPVSNIRYRMPVEPLIYILAAEGALMLYFRAKTKTA